MNKKDIYEHLANIYLDASTKKKAKKGRGYHNIFQKLFFISTFIIFILIIHLLNISQKSRFLFTNLNGEKHINSELAFVLQPNVVKINFNFGPATEETYRINLNELDLARFRALGFSVRKANYEDNIILKLELTNAAKEKSEAYFYNIPSYKWQEYKIKLADFKDISSWSKISSLSFIIEESNVNKKKGIVYLDNVRFLR